MGRGGFETVGEVGGKVGGDVVVEGFGKAGDFGGEDFLFVVDDEVGGAQVVPGVIGVVEPGDVLSQKRIAGNGPVVDFIDGGSDG